MARTMMNFGTMPTKKEFHTAWWKLYSDSSYPYYMYALRGSDAASARAAKVPIEGHFSEKKLYGIIKKLRDASNRGNDNAGSIASGILSHFDFEWV